VLCLFARILLGDIKSDGIVDIFDVVSAALAFGSTPGARAHTPIELTI